MSRTSIFVRNQSQETLKVKGATGQVKIEEGVSSVSPGDTVPVATIGDPGTTEHVTTGSLNLESKKVLALFALRRHKGENCAVDDDLTKTYGWGVTYSNDYNDHKSQFYRSLTITIQNT